MKCNAYRPKLQTNNNTKTNKLIIVIKIYIYIMILEGLTLIFRVMFKILQITKGLVVCFA